MTMLDRLRTPKLRSTVHLVVTALLVLPLGAVAQVPAATAASAEDADRCGLTAILENPCRPLLGAESNYYVPGATFPVRMKEHEARIGRSVDLVHIYITSKATMTDYEKSVAADPAKKALVNWRLSTSWAEAAAGTHDDKIAAMADSLRSIPQKVMVTLAHEPELHVSPGGGDPDCPSSDKTDSRGTTEDYVDMWHHVRDRFDAAGVDNVVWVMNYVGYVKYFGCAEALWPGNDYVDWVMWDPYPNGQSFTRTVGGFYDYLTTNSDTEHNFLSKPWGLAEWGYAGSNQATAYAMYADARAALRANVFPKLKAYLIWDNLVAGGNDDRVGFDSLGNPDPVEQAAYNAFANDPTFSPDSTPPTQVTGTSVGPVTPTSAQLTWSPASDEVRVAGYRIHRDGQLVATLAPNVTEHTDTGLVDGRRYTYTVTAFDPSANESSPGDPVPATTPDVTAPTVPGSLVASPGKRQVTLTWTPSSDNVAVSGYRVLRNGIPLPSTTGTTLVDSGLGELATYAYSVVAFDAAGNSSAAATQSARTLDSTPPRMPTTVRASVSGTSVRVTWTKPPDNVGVSSYDVYRGTTLLGRPTTATFTDVAPPQGKKLTYWVRAFDAAQNASAGSASATATVPDRTAPANPPSLTAVSGSRKVTLSWTRATDNVGVTSYLVYRGTTLIRTLPSTTLSYASTGLKTGTSYTFKLVARDAAGNRSTGRTVTARAR